MFSFLLSFLFLPARAVNIYTKPHILVLALALSHIFSLDRALSRRHVEPTVECAPIKKYITHFSVVLSCVCVYFFKYKYAYDFPFIFQLLLLPVWFIYISRTIAYIVFVC